MRAGRTAAPPRPGLRASIVPPSTPCLSLPPSSLPSPHPTQPRPELRWPLGVRSGPGLGPSCCSCSPRGTRPSLTARREEVSLCWEAELTPCPVLQCPPPPPSTQDDDFALRSQARSLCLTDYTPTLQRTDKYHFSPVFPEGLELAMSNLPCPDG